MTAKTEQLKKLMAEHRLSCADVARMLGRSVQIVRIWCSRDSRDIPDPLLQLLEIKCKGGAA